MIISPLQQRASDTSRSLEETVASVRQALLASLLGSWGSLEEVRCCLRAKDFSREELRVSAQSHLMRILQKIDTLIDHEIMERIIDLTLDELESERSCPDVRLSLGPCLLPDLSVHALIFSAFPHAANEIYPLMVDAYVTDLEVTGRRSFQVVGVHESWLVNGSFRRAIMFSEDDQGLVEATITGMPVICSAQVLALDLRDERVAHQRIEAALPGVRFSNPYAGAAKLDDKRWTGDCWQRAGLPTPRFVLLKPETNWQEALQRFSVGLDSLIFKPVDGTEGRGVSIIRDIVLPTEIHEPLLAMIDHDSVRYAAEGVPVRCTIRLNVCWDGMAHVESGYAQVAGTPDGIASVGRGGRVIPLSALWSRLCRCDGSLITPSQTNWQRLVDTAVAGTIALADALKEAMPRLVGIDLLLDLDINDQLQPVLLEVNPRPSGMCHSQYLTCDGPGDEPGVTGYFWKRISGSMTCK